MKIGDKVRIINYGHLIWYKDEKTDKIKWMDLYPELVGKEAKIVEKTKTQGVKYYGLKIKGEGYMSWFTKKQLEKIL